MLGPSPPKPSSKERSKSAISGDLKIIHFETHKLTNFFDGSNDKRGESLKRPSPRLSVVTRKDRQSSSAISTIPPRGNPRTTNSPAKPDISAESVPVDNPSPFAALMTDKELEKKEEHPNLDTCYTVDNQGCFQHLPDDELALLSADSWWQPQQPFNADATNGVVINNHSNNNFEYHDVQTSANPAFSQLHLLTNIPNHNFNQYTWAGS